MERVMNREMLVAKAHRHWEMWLPKKTKKLKDTGKFETAVQTAATHAYAEITALMGRGYQEREASDIILPKYVSLRPEPHEYD
jgi:hypothetical protein